MSNALTAFRALVRKDLAIFLRDRRALMVNVITPIVIAAFFGFLFAGSDDTVRQLPVAIDDQDGSALSKSIVADLSADKSLAASSLPEAEARERVRSGKLRAAIILPPGFGDAATRALFGRSDKPAIQLLYDPSQSFVRPIIEGLVTQYVMQRVTQALFSANGSTEVVDESLARVRANSALPTDRREDLISLLEAVRRYRGRAPAASGQSSDAGGMVLPMSFANVAVSSGPQYNSYAHSFAGMSVQFILFMGIDAGVTLLLMRQQGVWRRLCTAPLSRGVLLGSRVAGTTIIALLILAVVYLAAIALFKVRIAGSVPGFLAVSVAFAVLAASTGLMIAGLGKSVGATRGLSMFTALILVMLGGAWVPAFIFPGWLQQLSLWVPTRWAVDGFDAMTWRGQPFEAALAPVAVMLGWSVLFVLIAVWQFDWEAD
jgi:ABC-2 type transport system permease protein